MAGFFRISLIEAGYFCNFTCFFISFFHYLYPMIFIAGTQPKTEQYQSLQVRHCTRCHNDSQWILQKNQQFVSLFFMPVVPFKTEYVYYCPICGNAEALDRKTFELKIKKEAIQLKR